jgi:hypothetical protein
VHTLVCPQGRSQTGIDRGQWQRVDRCLAVMGGKEKWDGVIDGGRCWETDKTQKSEECSLVGCDVV